MIAGGLVEIVAGATVCTVSLRKLWNAHDVQVWETKCPEEAEAARREKRRPWWRETSEESLLSGFVLRGDAQPAPDLARDLWAGWGHGKGDGDGEKDGEKDAPPPPALLRPDGAVLQVKTADRLELFGAREVVEASPPLRFHEVACAALLVSAYHK